MRVLFDSEAEARAFALGIKIAIEYAVDAEECPQVTTEDGLFVVEVDGGITDHGQDYRGDELIAEYLPEED